MYFNILPVALRGTTADVTANFCLAGNVWTYYFLNLRFTIKCAAFLKWFTL